MLITSADQDADIDFGQDAEETNLEEENTGSDAEIISEETQDAVSEDITDLQESLSSDEEFDDGESSESAEVTRAEWLNELVTAMDIAVDEENYPDNYFSDLTSDNTYYASIMAAINYGMIDVNYGGEFSPNAAATREFAAHTANFCLGVQTDSENYTYTDSSDCTYPQDVQAAIDRGWFTLENGEFVPEKALTSEEKTKILEDVKTVQSAEDLADGGNNAWVFADYVVEVPSGTAVDIDENNVVTIQNIPVTVKQGDTFVVWPSDLPCMYKAESVSVSGDVTTIVTSEADTESAVISVNEKGTAEVDVSQIEAEEGVRKQYIETQDEAEAVGAAYGIKVSKGSVVLSKNISLGSGRYLNVVCNLSNLKLNHNINKGASYAYVTLTGKSTVTATVSGSITEALGASTVSLCNVRVLGVGKVSLSLEMNLSGTIAVTNTGNFTSGFEKNGDSFRLIGRYKRTGGGTSAQGTASLGINAQIGVDLLVVSGSIYARSGAEAKYEVDTYNDEKLPNTCVNITSWLYFRAGVNVKVFDKTYDRGEDIISKKNNGCLTSYHYEDGKKVDSCSRGKKYDNGGYYTPANSRYGSSAYGDGSSTGIGSDGQVYTIYTYSLDDDNNATITGYKGKASTLYIPKTIDGYKVVAIGNYAFQGNTALKVVTINDGVTYIGWRAFEGCTSLTSIILPESLTSIDSGVFMNTGLTSLTLPESLTSIGAYMLSGTPGVTSITIPKNVTTMQAVDGGWHGALYNSYVETVVFENGITAIPSRAVQGASHVTEVVIPDTVTYIGWRGFEGCTSLTSITLPESLTSIDSGVFMDTGLTSLTLPESLTSIGAYMLSGTPGVTSIAIPKNVTTMQAVDGGWHGTLYNSYVETVVFENGITAIPSRAVQGASYVTEVVIPDTVVSIGYAAFNGCASLTSIVLSDIITKMDRDVFYGCTSLKSATWNNTIATIPEGTFSGCTSLECFTMPSVVTTINGSAFSSCTSLAKVEWSENLKIIGSSAFYNCDALTELSIPAPVATIGENAFYNCDALTTVTMADTVTSIGNQAFYNCDALTKVTIPDSVTSFGTGMFYDCDALTDVTLGTGITSIPASTFEHCDVLEKLVVPYRVTSIGDNAFKDSVKFNSITIPRATASISSSAFSYPAKLTIYGVSGTYAETFAKENSITFVDQTINATKVTLSQNTMTLNKGKTAKLAMSVTPENFTDEVSWVSSDTGVATIDDSGQVKAVAVGTATIKVFAGEQSASCKVTVVQPVTSISLSKTSVTLEGMETVQLTASAQPADAANRELSWSSSDETVAAVDNTGLVKALKKGNAVITASAQDGSGITNTCSVTVSNTVYAVAGTEGFESNHKYENNCSDCWLYTSEGASFIQLTFDSRTSVEEDFDFIYIYDKDGNEAGKYTGTALAGQTVTVTGDTAKIRLKTNSVGVDWGFKVTDIKTDGSAVPTTTPSPTPTEAPNPTGTPVPTGTPTPTGTPNPTGAPNPTGTPNPTGAPTPTGTPNPTGAPTPTETPNATAIPNPTASPVPVHSHKYGAWKTISAATVFAPAKQRRTCGCGEYQEQSYGQKLNPTVKLTASKLTMKTGQSTTAFKAYGFAKGDSLKSVVSANKKLVKVSKVNKKGTFKLTAQKKTGKTKITVTLASNKKITFYVTVQKAKVKTTSISGVAKKITVAKGRTVNLKPTLSPVTSQEKITYSSSDKKVAAVSANGVVKGKKKGTATITIKSGSKKVKCKVTVK